MIIKSKVAVSACLLGVCCKYDGGDNQNEKVIDFIQNKDWIAVCPEQLGGLSTPRVPAEIVGDKVLTKAGNDVTENFVLGANAAMKLLSLKGCDLAILKSRSPSCGKGIIYDGTFCHSKIEGNGIFAQMVLDKHVRVITEEEL